MYNILAQGNSVRTECSEVRAPWPSAKYFPVRPDLTQSISILLYDHRHTKLFLFFFLFFLGNQIRNFHLCRSFWPKSQDLFSNKVVSICILRALLIKSPYEGHTWSYSWAGQLFPALRVLSHVALIRGFSQYVWNESASRAVQVIW